MGSFCGGIILTNSKVFYNYLKEFQNINQKFAAIQSMKKYTCLILNRKESLLDVKNNYDKYRIGPCLLLNFNKKFVNLLETIHVNKLASSDKFIFIKKLVLPIHFTISDQILEKKINEITTI